MTLEGYDFSDARPGGAYIKSQGREFVVRYLWSPSSGGLSNSEIADYESHGIGIAVVMEQGTGDALLGHDKGVQHAQLAISRLAALNLDQGIPIYFAVDTDTAWASVAAYFDGVASVLGAERTGVYGGARVIQGAQASTSATWFWQTYAWSGGKVLDGIHLLQYRNGQSTPGGAVDFCRAFEDNYGQLAAGKKSDPVHDLVKRSNEMSAPLVFTHTDGPNVARYAIFDGEVVALNRNNDTDAKNLLKLDPSNTSIDAIKLEGDQIDSLSWLVGQVKKQKAAGA